MKAINKLVDGASDYPQIVFAASIMLAQYCKRKAESHTVESIRDYTDLFPGFTGSLREDERELQMTNKGTSTTLLVGKRRITSLFVRASYRSGCE